MSSRPPIRHLAIIMDGNGRWAKLRGLRRTLGHHEGAERVEGIVDECLRQGIRYLTLYAFSTENWNRPRHEVNVLMRLLVRQLRKVLDKLVRDQVYLVAQGTLERLPTFAQAELQRVEQITRLDQPRLTINLSLSYGGRQEIVDCARAWGEKIRRGECVPEDITEASFRDFLYRPEIPDPDLLIRTGGEWRISNFLLWEIAYTELIVVDTLWPDFFAADLRDAFERFYTRERRFGKTSEQVKGEGSGLSSSGQI